MGHRVAATLGSDLCIKVNLALILLLMIPLTTSCELETWSYFVQKIWSFGLETNFNFFLDFILLTKDLVLSSSLLIDWPLVFKILKMKCL